MPALRTYCNPLSLPGSKSRSLADPAVIRHDGAWYLFVSWDQAWVSRDLASWEYHPVEIPVEVVGPALFERDGMFYLSGNGGIGMWRAPHPLGPWVHLGDILDSRGEKAWWADVMFFEDDDRTLYCYHHSGSGIGTDGVFVTPLDPISGFTRATAPTRQCFGHVPSHLWERWGDRNEHADVAWIEASWMTKHAGRYHLQYSGAGTEWNSYAVGLYTADSPTGPFTYDERSPLLKSRAGLLRGPGHHAIVEGPDGGLWCFYHVLMRNDDKLDRRLAMDPVGFDAAGNMHVSGPSASPRLVPMARVHAAAADADAAEPGWLALSIDKDITATSSAPGRDAAYAVDDHARTWWQAADLQLPQSLEVDLAGAFTVHAARIILREPGRTRAPSPATVPRRAEGCVFRIELSHDGTTWTVAHQHLDRTDDRDIHYVEIAPTRARRVRLTITSTPPGLPAAVLDLTVFGRS